MLQFSESPEQLVKWQLLYRRQCVHLIDAGRPDLGAADVRSIHQFIKTIFDAGEPERVSDGQTDALRESISKSYDAELANYAMRTVMTQEK